jgi:hypothetical protein
LFALAFILQIRKFPLAEIHLHFAEGKLSFRRRCTALTIFRRKMEAEADKAESKFAAGKYIIIHAKRDYHSAKRTEFFRHIPE